MAGMGQEKLSIKFVVGSYDTATGSFDRVWDSPKKVEYPVEISRVLHNRGRDWGAPATIGIYRVGTDGLAVGEPNQHTNSPLFFL